MPTSYSAQVDMQLLLPGGLSLHVAQCGPDFLILKDPATCGATEAVLAVMIDGRLSRYPCPLPGGISGRLVRLEQSTMAGVD